MVIDVSAAAVVLGATVAMGPPTIADSVGGRWSTMARQPSPSRTSSTTWSAPTTGSGSHVGALPSSSAGTSPPTQAPR